MFFVKTSNNLSDFVYRQVVFISIISSTVYVS
jgi:hypothetical protein